MKKMKKGFTLVEIMIVVAIIAILAAVAIPNFIKYRQNSQAAACVSNLKQIEAAAEQAKLAGNTPADVSDLIGTDKYIKNTPTCPANGTYGLGNDQTGPTCSIGENSTTDKSAWHKLIKE